MVARRGVSAAALAICVLAGPAASQNHPSFQTLWNAVAHAPGCTQKDDVDLIIVACDRTQSLWYFTKPGHPAHPGVVERRIARNKTGVDVSENGWSFAADAAQPAFKTFLAQIRALDEQMKEGFFQARATDMSKLAGVHLHGNTKASARDNEAAISLTSHFFALEDAGRYEDAYALFDPGLTAQLSLAQYETSAAETRSQIGRVKSRVITDIDWEKDVPHAPPGLYVALNYVASAERGQLCGYLAWRKQPDNFFILIREQTYVVPNSSGPAQSCTQ